MSLKFSFYTEPIITFQSYIYVRVRVSLFARGVINTEKLNLNLNEVLLLWQWPKRPLPKENIQLSNLKNLKCSNLKEIFHLTLPSKK